MRNGREELIRASAAVISAAERVEDVVGSLRLLSSVFLCQPDNAAYTSNKLAELQELARKCRGEMGDRTYDLSAFHPICKLLLYKVAPTWLTHFSPAEQSSLFDSFFLSASPRNALFELAAALREDDKAISIQAERLLDEVLIRKCGIEQIASEFEQMVPHKGDIDQVAQLISSLPDRTRLKFVSARAYISSVVSQLLAVLKKQPDHGDLDLNGAYMFTSQIIAKLCRRGHADVVVLELVLRLRGIRSGSSWQQHVAPISDAYALERFCEALLFAMEKNAFSDSEAYDCLLQIFGSPLEIKASLRDIFTCKFLLDKVFSFSVLKWVLDYNVFCQAPQRDSQKNLVSHVQMHVLRSLAVTWADLRYIQVTAVEQQAYLTAALGVCVRALTKELISAEGLLKYLLEGVTKRLESPLPHVRRMAKQLAFVISTVVNPENSLFLEDGDTAEDLLKWDVPDSSTKLLTKEKRAEAILNDSNIEIDASDDPGYIEDDDDASLRPYEMSDNELDLEKSKYPAQLAACASNLRKGDDPEAVERALEVCEKLIRLEPVELQTSASDLAHALVHVRCSAVAVEGEEETVEIKRHRALVALLVFATLPAVTVVTKELYSTHVDVSQRLLILDVLSDAAKELASGTSTDQLKEPREVAGPWVEVFRPAPGHSLVAWGQTFERELPPKKGRKELGKARRRNDRFMQLQKDKLKQSGTAANRFAPVAAAFMLPVMRDYDKQSHGVDFLGRDYVVLGRLVYTLGVFVECVAYQSEAAGLGAALLDMLKTRAIANHPEPYVRRSVLFAASRVLLALHPAQVSHGQSSLLEALDWIRDWASRVADRDADAECSKMALACLHLYSEVGLQASRSLEPCRPSNAPLILPM